jgi:hypothetical protein
MIITILTNISSPALIRLPSATFKHASIKFVELGFNNSIIHASKSGPKVRANNELISCYCSFSYFLLAAGFIVFQNSYSPHGCQGQLEKLQVGR